MTEKDMFGIWNETKKVKNKIKKLKIIKQNIFFKGVISKVVKNIKGFH